MIEGLVVSGTSMQYWEFLHANDLSSIRFKRIANRKDVFSTGRSLPVYMVGTWYTNPDLFGVIFELVIRESERIDVDEGYILRSEQRPENYHPRAHATSRK